jgi:hypothetical protein
MMNWILLVMAGVVALVMALLMGGLLTPRHFTVRRQVVLRSGPERVHGVLDALPEWPVWVERAITVEHASVTLQPPQAPQFKVVALRDDNSSEENGSFQFVLEPLADGSQVTCVAEGVLPNLITRFLRTHLVGLSGDADAALRSLAEQLDEFDRHPRQA